MMRDDQWRACEQQWRLERARAAVEAALEALCNRQLDVSYRWQLAYENMEAAGGWLDEALAVLREETGVPVRWD